MPIWQKLIHWVRNAPIEDVIDQRQAPMLHVVLAVPMVLVPIVLAVSLQTRSFGAQDWISLVIMLYATVCFCLLRRGHFRLAASLTVVGTLTLIGFSYQRYGLRAQAGAQITHLVPLMLAGLLLGRRGVWKTLMLLLPILALGAWIDFGQAGGNHALREEVRFELLLVALKFALVALILDRLISALGKAVRRSEELSLICDQLEAEIEQKERTQAQLLHAQKMDAVGRLAGGIAHDFNNILAIIMGYASKPGAALHMEQAQHSLEGIRNASRRAVLVTRRLLSLSRANDSQAEVFDVNALLRHCEPLLRALFSQSIDVHIELAAQPLWVCLDKAQFELALLNITGNARDAMPHGGEFHVRVSADDMHVNIVLSDDGCGMSADVVKHMFDPFYTTKPSSNGTGIGLPVVHRLITEAAGSIHVDSACGHGTRLTLTLPREREPGVAPASGAVTPPPLRVLLIDDDHDLLRVLGDALSARDCKVFSAASAADALGHAYAVRTIDVVVSDFHLPDARGDHLLRQLAAILPHARRVLISGRRSFAHDALPYGIDGFIAKPFAPASLHALLARLMAKRSAPVTDSPA